MPKKLYGSVNGATKQIKKLYGSVNGVTKEIKKLYGSVGGVTKQIFPDNRALLMNGVSINRKFKTLSGDSNPTENTNNTMIKSIQTASALPSGFAPTDANIISTSDSPHPIYAWFNNTNNAGIIYLYTEGDIVASSLSFAFNRLSSLTHCPAISSWDTSKVEEIGYLFQGCNITDTSPLANWDTSSLRTMSSAFSNCIYLTDISALSNWDTSKLADMQGAFYNSWRLTDISALSGWNTSALTMLSNAFWFVTDIDARVLNGWDVSKVTNMTNAFGCPADKYPSWYTG